MAMRKGFYFSFDAILALTVMSATLVMMITMMGTNYSNLNQQSDQANSIRTESRDVMSLASSQTFETYNESFQQELIANSVMENEDMQKSVLNGITYLWAAGNFSYAEEATERYFDPQMDGPYQIQIQEGGNTYNLPQDVERPGSAGFVTTSSSLVSGHRLNASNTGFRSRARVLNAEAQRTDITPISPSGSIPDDFSLDANFETTQYVEVPEDWNVDDAVLDLNYRSSEGFFGGGDVVVEVNGETVEPTETLAESEDNSYQRYNVADEIESGSNNSVTISINDFIVTGSVLNPGSRLRIDYTEQPSIGGEETVTERYPVKNVYSEFGSFFSEDVSGVFDVENFEIPQTAEIQNAEMVVNADGVGSQESPTGWDVRSVMNGNTVIEEEAFGSYERTVDVTEAVQPGNNLLQLYINHDGEDQFWGGSSTELNSDPGTEEHSYIEVTYTDQNQVGYGKYEASTAVEAGDITGESEPTEPLTFSPEFDYDNIAQTSLYMAEFNPEQPEVRAGTTLGNLETVYDSEGATPTLVSVNPDLLSTESANYIEMSDPGENAQFLQQSLLEYSTYVEPRVGYGPVFDTQDAAQQNAVERLENKSGDFFNFEDIEPSSVTIGGERRLWGPSTVTLVRWKE